MYHSINPAEAFFGETDHLLHSVEVSHVGTKHQDFSACVFELTDCTNQPAGLIFAIFLDQPLLPLISVRQRLPACQHQLRLERAPEVFGKTETEAAKAARD